MGTPLIALTVSGRRLTYVSSCGPYGRGLSRLADRRTTPLVRTGYCSAAPQSRQMMTLILSTIEPTSFVRSTRGCVYFICTPLAVGVLARLIDVRTLTVWRRARQVT